MRTAVIFGCSKGNGSLREQAVGNPESKQVSNQSQTFRLNTMKTINTYILAGTLLLAGAFLAGCSKATDSLQPEAAQKPEAEEEILTPEVPQGPNEFILKVSSINTKALADLGETLGSEWTQGDSVRVYNATTKQNIEGFLFAEADGTSTTFSGTVAGNFNQGDVLRLYFLSDNYAQQDGTLEGVASQCDYAVADVEILEIDPEAKTITTEVAEFVKQQAVVKFNLTNRKYPVENLDVKAFYGFGVLPGSETPFGILVTPAAATNELYVAIPYIQDMKITFEALGADGYYYRLIVPSVTFEDGLYYRRQLNMKRKALVKAPVAKANLSYNGKNQALVDSAHVYWTVNNQEVILDDDLDYQEQKCVISYFVKREVTEGTVPTAPTADENGWMTTIPTRMNAGTYYVWTKMTGNYDYEDVDVSSEPVPVVIGKGTATLDASAASGTLTYNGQSQPLLAYAAKLKIGNTDVTGGRDASNTGCTIQYYVSTSDSTPTGGSWSSSYSATNAGTYYIWIKVTGNGDIKDIAQVSKATKAINPKVVTSPTINWTGGPYTYNGSAKQPTVTAVKDGNVTVSSNEYNVGYQNNTNAGTATIVISDKAGGNYTISGSTPFTINKAAGYISLSRTSVSTTSGNSYTVEITSSHGGYISYTTTGETGYYTWSRNGNTFTVNRHINSESKDMYLKVTCDATTNYTAATAECRFY